MRWLGFYRPLLRTNRAVCGVFRFYQTKSDAGSGVICSEYQAEHSNGLQRGRQTVFISTRDLKACLMSLKKMGKIARKYYIKKVDNNADMLVEYKDLESIEEIHKYTRCFSTPHGIPVKTRHVFAEGLDHNLPIDISQILPVKKPRPLKAVIDHTLPLGLQILQVHQEYKMSDYDKLSRYFIASTIEDFSRQILPASEIRLFGSSVNGLGRYDCDLDMTLNIRSDAILNQEYYRGQVFFKYLSKFKGEERNNSRTILQLMSLMMYALYPCSHQVTSILSARVPILRFTHTGLSVTCDLSMNPIGPTMSEILYKMGLIDDRFVALTFVIRIWARRWEITQPSPGPWPTNFTITLLVLFYLQRHPAKILPPIEKFITVLGNEEDGYRYVVKKWQKEDSKSNKNVNLGDLLKGFFDMYSTFDFEKYGVSVLTGNHFSKDSESILVVENPLQPALNVSRNVMKSELDDFQKHCQKGLIMLEDGFRLKDLLRTELDNTATLPDIRMDQLFNLDKDSEEHKDELDITVESENTVETVTAERS